MLKDTPEGQTHSFNDGCGEPAHNPMQNTAHPMQEWEIEFEKMCILNKDGKCKYWNPESFGYSENDKEASLDKFFPENIKSFIRTQISLAKSQERQRIMEIIKNAKEGNVENNMFSVSERFAVNDTLTDIITALTQKDNKII